MAIVHADRGSDARSDELRGFGDVVRTYVGHRSPQVIWAGVAVVLIVRLIVGSVGWADLIVVVATLMMTGIVEWFLHLILLHAPEESTRMTKFGTGTGHREHHLDPTNVGWLMLAPMDAFVFFRHDDDGQMALDAEALLANVGEVMGP